MNDQRRHDDSQDPTQHRPKIEFRADLQGVRAIAVVLVVLFHAQVALLPGGYIGVDIFYVLSGYFITGILIREYKATGRISIRAFYERRIRRILPASSLVLCATSVLASALISPLLLRDLAQRMIFANFFASNFAFAKDAVDYLANDVNAYPILHYWSLAVEEQFYIFFPTLLITLLFLAKKIKSSTLTFFMISFSALISLGLCIIMTSTNQPVAFFMLPTRAWELLCGALIALFPIERRTLGPRTSLVFQVSGLALIGLATFLFDPQTAFPGYAAIVPVLGTSLIVLAQPHNSIVTRMLSRSLPLAIGRWSFSLYLWHWPLLTVAWAHFDKESLPINLTIVAVAIILSALTYRLWENPIRLNQYFPNLRFRVTFLTLGTLLTPLAFTTLLYLPQPPDRQLDKPAPPVTSLSTLRESIATSLDLEKLPRYLSPTTGSAANDIPISYHDGCHQGTSLSPLKPCIYGKPQGQRSIWLVGDSHAGQWFNAVDSIAKKNNLRLIVHTKSACPTVLTVIPNRVSSKYMNCLAFNKSVLKEMNRTKPETVVISGRHNLLKSGANGLLQYLQAMPTSSKVVFLEDTPNPSINIPQCVTTPFKSLQSCNVVLTKQALSDMEFIKAQVNQSQARYVSTTSWVCIKRRCPAVVNNILMYRDDSHISNSAAVWLSELLEKSLNLTN